MKCTAGYTTRNVKHQQFEKKILVANEMECRLYNKCEASTIWERLVANEMDRRLYNKEYEA